MNKNIIIILLIVILGMLVYLLLKPDNKKEEIHITHDMVLIQVEKLGKLELVKYNIRDVMEYKKIRQWLPNSKTALLIVGEVIACVDLTMIEKEDIMVFGDSVSLLLPVPEICHFRVDHSRSRIYDVQYGLWDTPKLVDEAYQEAERQIYRQAIDMGIAAESHDNAIKILTPVLHALGFKKVSISFKKSPYGQNPEQKNINILPPMSK